MSLTKVQKTSVINEAVKKINSSKAVVFAEFNKVGVEDLKRLRRELKKASADIKVLKKRLLNIALKNAGIQFDPVSRKTQLGTVFASGDMASVAAIMHKFSKELTKAKKGDFGVIAAYDAGEKRVVDANEFKAIATLPSKEVLLAQIAMMLTMPLKQMMMVLNERSKKVQ